MRLLSFVRAAAVLAAAHVAGAALGADLPVKAAAFTGYPSTNCGFYYGLGTGGSASAVNGAVVGTQIIQGDINGLVGYACPFGAQGFWFVEGSVGFSNLNGSVNGLAMSGPLIFTERFGAGSPINSLFNPFGNSIALPAIPTLPAGVTLGAATPYVFGGIVEQDIAAQIGLDQHNHQWVIAPLLGVGLLTRLNNNGVVVDTWAGWQMNSQSFCPGGGTSCARLGNGGRVGVSFKY